MNIAVVGIGYVGLAMAGEALDGGPMCPPWI